MNGKDFIRRVRQWAANQDPRRGVVIESSRGKGGHQMVSIEGGGRTTVKTGEVQAGLLNAMLKQIGIPRDEF